jgi:hypothetical protein
MALRVAPIRKPRRRRIAGPDILSFQHALF